MVRPARVGEQGVAHDRASITAFRDITLLAAGPAGELMRSTVTNLFSQPPLCIPE
jgi:hypothetical protein